MILLENQKVVRGLMLQHQQVNQRAAPTERQILKKVQCRIK